VITVVNTSLHFTTKEFDVRGPFAKFAIQVPSSATHGTPFTATIYADDAAGNHVTSYVGHPTWTDTSGQLTGSPASFSSGTSTNNVTLAKAVASDRIRVTDGAVTQQSAAFPVH
jgi:hypothetical protein